MYRPELTSTHHTVTQYLHMTTKLLYLIEVYGKYEISSYTINP